MDDLGLDFQKLMRIHPFAHLQGALTVRLMVDVTPMKYGYLGPRAYDQIIQMKMWKCKFELGVN